MPSLLLRVGRPDRLARATFQDDAWSGLGAADPRAGKTVLLIGSGGGVGSAAAQIARHRGARVFGADRRPPHPDAPVRAIAEKLISRASCVAGLPRAWLIAHLGALLLVLPLLLGAAFVLAQSEPAGVTAGVEPITPIPAPPRLDARRLTLGDRLFHDPRLSHNNATSCETCHDLR